MFLGAKPRLEHLRRMTDTRGLIRAARGDSPDRFSGYSTQENAEALRLCALLGSTVDAELAGGLAKTYFEFLVRARKPDGRTQHECDAHNRWHEHEDDLRVQSKVARALSAVMVSELPIGIRLAAADWWKTLLTYADSAWSPHAAANWLIAIGRLHEADPGRDLGRAEALARWLVEDCYQPTRSPGWDWFMPGWVPEGAVIPTGLWVAHEMFKESQFAEVAHAATRFVIDHLLADGVLSPPGTNGLWSRSLSKSQFDQSPSDVLAVVELLCAAERSTGSPAYRSWIDIAAKWFEGTNIAGRCLIDLSSGGCHDALTAGGLSPNQGGAAVTSYLLTHASLANRGERAARTASFDSVLYGSSNGL